MAGQKTDERDVYVGQRIAEQRRKASLTQRRVAQSFGMSAAQLQKYEKGTNRISASKLQQSAIVLQVPVEFFFEGGPSVAGTPQAKCEAPSPAYVSDFLATSEGLALTRAFTRINDSKLRRSIVDLVEQIAARELSDRR